VKKVIRAFYRLVHRLASTPGGGVIIGRVLRPVRVVEVLTQNIVTDGVLYPPEQAITSRVQEFGAPFVTPDIEQFPEVGWRVVSDATYMTTRHFSYLVSGTDMMIGRRRNPGPWRVVRRRNHVVWQDGTDALVTLTRGHTLSVDGAIALGGRAHTNWYHWLVDALPQLHQASRLPEPFRHWPVLVPAPIFRYPTMVQALELFLDGREVIKVPEWSRVRGTIVWIDSLEILNVPESLTAPKPQSQIHLLHRSGMESYRDVFLNAYGHTPSPYGERVFLTRLGTRRSYNQDEIAEVAAQFGFTAVAPETLTLSEQVSLFRNATHLMGPSGAGFAGVLFCQKDAKILCWQDSRLQAMTILPDLATLNHAEYWHVFYDPESGGIFTGDYHLDPHQIRQALAEFVRAAS
jgi:capsular polysaccharide biosynthesis protein